MKVAYASDLHLEFNPPNVLQDLANTKQADVLILAGDILCSLNDPRTQQIVAEIREQYKYVIAVAGNHEFYGTSLTLGYSKLRDLYDRMGIYFLHDQHVMLDGKVFYGGTLWTDFDNENPNLMYAAPGMLNDYRWILDATPSSILELFNNSYTNMVEFLSVNMGRRDEPLCIITHHAPTHKSIHPKYKGDPASPLFYSELSALILDNQQIMHWVHGHVHDAAEYMCGDTYVHANPYGYPNQNPDWKLKHFDI